MQLMYQLVMKFLLKKMINWLLQKLLMWPVPWCKVNILFIIIIYWLFLFDQLENYFWAKLILYLFTILGQFVPLNLKGNIIVDRVLASCCGSFEHDLAHIMMAPLQWFPEIVEMIFGETNVFSTYVEFGIELGRSLLPNGLQFLEKK